MIGDSIGAAVGAEKQRKQSEKELRSAQTDRQRALDMAATANYEPFLVSDVIDPYQRSQSPVARGYLESFLTGANPGAVQGTRQGAPQQQQAAQGQFNQAYGGWDQLRAKQREMESSTPWDIKPFKGPAVTDEMRWNARLGRGGRQVMGEMGLTYKDLEALERIGITVDPNRGELDGTDVASDKEARALRQLAEDPSRRGLLEQFMAQARTGKTGPKSAQEAMNTVHNQPWNESRAARVFGRV